MLAEAAAKTQNNDLDGAAQSVDDAFIDVEKQETQRRDAAKRRGTTILEAGSGSIRCDGTLLTVAADSSGASLSNTRRSGLSWHPDFRTRYDEYLEDGEAKGINFSLEVAIQCARGILDTAGDAKERGPRPSFWRRASEARERESGTARLEQAVTPSHRVAGMGTRKRVPLLWAIRWTNSATRLGRSGNARAARRGWSRRSTFRDALLEWTRERVPLRWATTQNNLGNALSRLGQRESGTARLEAGGQRLSRRAAGIHARARAARMGGDAEQPRHRALDARGTRERHGAAGAGGRRLSRRAAGIHARARAARLGDDAERPRQRAWDSRGTRERHRAAGGGG